MSKILVTGACGQLGSELTTKLRELNGAESVIATDISQPNSEVKNGPFEHLDVMDSDRINEVVDKYDIDTIYHLAALLSANAEQKLDFAWKLNMEGLLNVLKIAKHKKLDRIFWPSSIAVFGPDAKKDGTPQESPCNPTTVYGISKLAGEQWCSYFYDKFGVDVRSIRYPGLIGYKSLPGGGTTDYAVDIYHKAVEKKPFECFLDKDTILPMMYMDDAVQATIDLMAAPKEKVKIRTSYNLSAISFSPEEIANSIKKEISDFEIYYSPDQRQTIAESWPDRIDDTAAREDWGWQHSFSLDQMTQTILANLPGFWDKKG